MKNPLMTASGTFGWGTEYSDYFDPNDLGAVVLKGLTLEPRTGNAGTRIAETPGGMLNSIGLENPGIDVFEKETVKKIYLEKSLKKLKLERDLYYQPLKMDDTTRIRILKQMQNESN